MTEWDWARYHLLRWSVLFASISTLAASIGLTGALLAAAIFGLTIHFDYWSNAVELLAVALVIAGGVLGWHWGYLLAAGIVLGTGRETLPLLALLGTPCAIALGAGAAAGHLAVRMFARTEGHWKGSLDYASAMWRTNWESLIGTHGPDYQFRVLTYLTVGGLAATMAPMLAMPLLVLTALVARVDEPRVLTMLTPFAAMGVLRWL